MKQKSIPFLSVLTLCIILTFSACKTEPVIPETPEVSFVTEVLPIITSNCTSSGCHGKDGKRSFELLNYEEVMNGGEVKAMDARGSKMYKLITTNSESNRMPRKPYAALSEEQIAVIYLWIMQGAKNN